MDDLEELADAIILADCWGIGYDLAGLQPINSRDNLYKAIKEVNRSNMTKYLSKSLVTKYRQDNKTNSEFYASM